ITNTAMAVWSGTGRIGTGTNSVFNNTATGTFDIQSDALYSLNYGGTSTFNNAGTLTKSAGIGATSISVIFNNTGAVNGNSGTLALGGTVNWSAGTMGG